MSVPIVSRHITTNTLAPAARGQSWEGDCPNRQSGALECVCVKIHTRARRLKFLCLDMLCVAQIRRKNKRLRLNHKLEEILHWTFRAPVVLGGVEIVYREGRILNLVQYSGD
ncbi:unnamed protein product [Ascophyllum nodosum]